MNGLGVMVNSFGRYSFKPRESEKVLPPYHRSEESPSVRGRYRIAVRLGALLFAQLGSSETTQENIVGTHPLLAVILMAATFFNSLPSMAATGQRDSSQRSTQMTESDAQYDIKAPPSAEEFWKKVLEILAADKGYINEQTFADVFGIKLLKTREEYDGIGYGLTKGRDWYASAQLDVQNDSFRGSRYRGAGSGLSLFWNADPKQLHDDPQYGWCISLDQAITDAERLGWVNPRSRGYEEPSHPRPPFFYEFQRDDKSALLSLLWGYSHKQRCVYGVMVLAERKAAGSMPPSTPKEE